MAVLLCTPYAWVASALLSDPPCTGPVLLAACYAPMVSRKRLRWVFPSWMACTLGHVNILRSCALSLQVSSDTLEPAVSGVLTLYSAWYPGPGVSGTYDWDGILDMVPNPFQLWGFAGISTGSSHSGTSHRRCLRLVDANQEPADHAEALRGGSQLSCSATACLKVGQQPGRRLLAADKLPVQGRVSVRESQIEDPLAPSSGTSPSTSGSSGTSGLTPGSTTAIDDEISAFVPGLPDVGSPVQGVPAEPPPAPNPAEPSTGIPLPADIIQTVKTFSPVLIASVAVAVSGMCLCGFMYIRRRRQRGNTEQDAAPNQTQPLRGVYWVHVKRPSWGMSDSDVAPPSRRRSSVCQPSQVIPDILPDVTHTDVQRFYSDDGSDSSFGHRPVLPPSRDTLSDV